MIHKTKTAKILKIYVPRKFVPYAPNNILGLIVYVQCVGREEVGISDKSSIKLYHCRCLSWLQILLARVHNIIVGEVSYFNEPYL